MSNVQFNQVSLNARAVVSEGGRHIERTLSFSDGHQKILGCLLGEADGSSFVLMTDAKSAERFEITQGDCEVAIGDEPALTYREGQSFVVASATKVWVLTAGVLQYIRHLEG